MVFIAFFGYILPWGQMSYWAAMVITTLFGSLPLFGPDFLLLIWGSFTIDNATLHRFYSLHFALSFVLLFLVLSHLALLHEVGSNNPTGIFSVFDKNPFIPFYLLKDSFFIVLILLFFSYFVYFLPDFLGHVDNFIHANFLMTPLHIVPEWYFLPLYAVLRSVTSKTLGIFLLFSFVFSLFLFPIIFKNIIFRSKLFDTVQATLFGFVIVL